MIENHDSDALTIGPVVRLEDVGGLGARGVTIVAWWLLTLPLLEDRGPCGPRCWAFFAWIPLGPLVFFWWMLRDSTRRSVTWRLDEEGVGRWSTDGVTRFLLWEDVEAVQMLEDTITLRGGGVDVAIPWKTAGTDRKAVGAFVAARLPAGFDPNARPRAFGPIGPFLKRAALAVAWTLLFLATLVGPGLAREFLGRWVRSIEISLFYIWTWIAVSALYRHAREAEESTWLRPAADATEHRAN